MNLDRGPVAGLCNGSRKSYKRWFCGDIISKETASTHNERGETHSKYNKTKYIFISPKEERVIDTCYGLYTKYQLNKDSVYDIVKGRRKSHFGWKFVGAA